MTAEPKFHALNLLPVSVSVALATSPAGYAQSMDGLATPHLERHDFPRPGCAWTAVHDCATGRSVVVALGDTDGCDGITIACVLVHEAQHVWQAYCQHVGERVPGNEQAAYAVQSIAEYLMREFVRQVEGA